MIQSKEKTIEGMVDAAQASVIYKCTQFPAMTGMRLAVKLAKTFGGGLGAVSGDIASVMDMDVSKVVNGILENLDEEKTPQLISELLSKTERNGVFLTTDVIDKVYAANYGELFKALQFVLEVNFGGFIGALAQAGNIGLPTKDSAGEKR